MIKGGCIYKTMSCSFADKSKPQKMKKISTLLLAMGLIGSQSFAQKVPMNGLVGHWSFNSSTAAANYGSIYGDNHGAVSTTDRFGNADMAMQFASGPSYIGLGDSYDNFACTPNTGAISFSFWVYFDAVDIGTQPLVVKSGDSNCSLDERQYAIRLNGEGKIEVVWYGTLGVTEYIGLKAPQVLQAGQWYHIAVTYSAAEIAVNGSSAAIQIYIDGQNQANTIFLSGGSQLAAQYGMDNGAAHIGLGAYLDDSGDPCYSNLYLKGKMDDVRVYDRKIDYFDVQLLYNEADPIPPVAVFNFNDGTVNDQSGYGNHATNFSAVPTTDRFGNPNAAMQFFGTRYINLPDSILLSEDLTISLWFRTTLEGGIFGYQGGAYPASGVNYVPIVHLGPTGLLHATLWQGFVADLNAGNSTTFYDDNWHHVVIAGDITGQDFYIDNQLISQGNLINVLPNMIKSQLGVAQTGGGWQDGNGSWYFFDGDIDDVSIYYRKLNNLEVSNLYTEGNPITSTNEIVNTHLSIYPNPTEGLLTISTNQKWDNAQMVDALGRTVANFNAQSGNTIDVSDLEAGIYFVQLNKDGARLTTERVIVK